MQFFKHFIHWNEVYFEFVYFFVIVVAKIVFQKCRIHGVRCFWLFLISFLSILFHLTMQTRIKSLEMKKFSVFEIKKKFFSMFHWPFVFNSLVCLPWNWEHLLFFRKFKCCPILHTMKFSPCFAKRKQNSIKNKIKRENTFLFCYIACCRYSFFIFGIIYFLFQFQWT